MINFLLEVLESQGIALEIIIECCNLLATPPTSTQLSIKLKWKPAFRVQDKVRQLSQFHCSALMSLRSYSFHSHSGLTRCDWPCLGSSSKGGKDLLPSCTDFSSQMIWATKKLKFKSSKVCQITAFQPTFQFSQTNPVVNTIADRLPWPHN